MEHKGRASGLQDLAKYCSIYLASAFLVLLGSYMTLYEGGAHRTVELREMFGTLLAYQLAVLLVMSFLYRVRSEVRDSLVLLAILGVFLCDGLLLQQLYDWESGYGMTAALVGGGSGIAILIAAAVALGIPLRSRLVGVAAAIITFVRFGPALLVGSTQQEWITPSYVALGWLFAACLLPIFLLRPTARAGSRLPMLAMERWGIAGCLTFGLVHLTTIGNAFDRAFRLEYLSPFLILLAPVLEYLLPIHRAVRAYRIVVHALPMVGLALAAGSFPPAMFSSEWARAWPLTPFYFALILTACVQLWRSINHRSVPLRFVAALLAAAACLGGDLPEILMRARFPHLWQVLAVTAIIWAAINWTRPLRIAMVVQAAPAFLFASWVAERSYPLAGAYFVALAFGMFVIEHLTGWSIPRAWRLGLVATCTLIPIGVLLAGYDVPVRIYLAIASCAAIAAMGVLNSDRLLWQFPAVVAAIGVLGYPAAIQQYGEVSPGKLVTQLGFVLLLVGFLHSLFGGWLREQWRFWWHDESASRQPRSQHVARDTVARRPQAIGSSARPRASATTPRRPA